MTNKFKYFLLFTLLIPCWIIAGHYSVDFVNLYATAQYTYSDLSRVYAQNGNLGRYFYGPVSLIFIKPLALLPYVTAKWFWVGVQTLCYVFFWRALYQLYPFLNDSKRFWGWLLIFIVAINPIHNNYQSNNIQTMLATMLIIAEVWGRSNSETKQFLAGVLVVLSAAIKVFPLFLVGYYFFFKPTAVRRGVIMGSAFALVAPLLYFGTAPGMTLYRDFLLNLTTYGADNNFSTVPDLLCLPSLMSRLNFSSFAIHGTILFIAATFFLWVAKNRKQLSDPRMNLHYGAMAWALCVFLNPSTRPHYFMFYLPAFCSVVEFIYEGALAAELKIGILISTLLIAFTAQGIVGKQLNDTLEFKNLPTYGMVILCGLLIYAIGRAPKLAHFRTEKA